MNKSEIENVLRKRAVVVVSSSTNFRACVVPCSNQAIGRRFTAVTGEFWFPPVAVALNHARTGNNFSGACTEFTKGRSTLLIRQLHTYLPKLRLKSSA